MSNILDYIAWRGDLSIKQDKFNAVDNLILSRFSYFALDDLLENEKKITIKEAYKRAMNKGIPKSKILQIDDEDLFPAMANSKRFGELYITDFVNKIDKKEEKQFSAITILIPDNTVYVAYRGTDNTLVGWKEDFNMSFSGDVPSQHDAVEYLEQVAKKIARKKLRVGGHSKGGNLAVFAASFCNEKVKERIEMVYNNDGPGMSSKVIKTKEYKSIVKKVHTYLPQSSVIGRLLYHEEKYTIVQSVQKGIMQHDLYSWQVHGNDFVTLDEITNGSQIADKVIKGWLNGVTPDKREEFIDILYQILSATDATTLSELEKNWIKNAKTILKAYNTTDEESKKIITQTISEVLSITKTNIISSISKNNTNKERKNENSH